MTVKHCVNIITELFAAYLSEQLTFRTQFVMLKLLQDKALPAARVFRPYTLSNQLQAYISALNIP